MSWYTCGPTVYDSAHLGHARAYVTFDIIRRILDDYFGIHVFYVMNITDIDDKIILRARRNFLFDQYLSEVALKAPSEFIKDAKNAFEEAMHVLEVKVENLEVKAKEIDSRRHQKELNEQIQGEKLKLKNIQTEYEKFQAVERENPTDLVQKLAPLCKDVISQRIDREKGSSVSDLSIFQKHAFHFESEFLEDMKNLGVREPDVLTRVSEYIPHIVDYIKKIIDRGFAYESNGSVYFDVVKFSSPDSGHVYAKLSPWSVGNLELLGEGEGALGTSETEKRSSGDFALWKKSKPGEPYWESPWGNGRPGWHIECSAMASDILGSNFDIHSGGEDLMFPHHDNEIAQSEAYYDNQQWVNYFWHAGHLSIEGLKMSKSLKNFITIKQALQTHSSRQIRMAFLLQSWHATMNYSDEALKEAVSKEKKFREFFLQVQTFLRKGLGSNQAWTDTDKVLHADLIQAQSDVHERLLDNFDYPSAIDILLCNVFFYFLFICLLS